MAGRVPPDFTELQGGIFSAPATLLPCVRSSPSVLRTLTVRSGIYKWSTDVNINSNIVLAGACGDTWIFQIAGSLNQAVGTTVSVQGGALAANVCALRSPRVLARLTRRTDWQIAGRADILGSAFNVGIINVASGISVGAGTTIQGRLFAGTAVTLNQACVSLSSLL